MPINNVQASRNILIQAITVTFEVVEPPPWLARQRITLKATVMIDGYPYKNQWVRWYCVEADKLIGTSMPTDDNGIAICSWLMPFNISPGVKMPCNTWTFQAVHRDSGVRSNTVSGAVAHVTRLSIDAPTPVGANVPFTISGLLEYESDPDIWSPLPNKIVSLFYNTTKIGDATTASDGTYSLTTSIPTSGMYSLTATYAGEGLLTIATLALGITNIGIRVIAPIAIGIAMLLL